MSVRVLRAAAISALLIATACSAGNASSTPAIALGDQGSGPFYVNVIGLLAAHLRACYVPQHLLTNSGRGCFAWQ